MLEVTLRGGGIWPAGKEGRNTRAHNGFVWKIANCSSWLVTRDRWGKWQGMGLERWDISGLPEQDCPWHAQNIQVLRKHMFYSCNRSHNKNTLTAMAQLSLWIVTVFPWPETFTKIFLSRSWVFAVGPNFENTTSPKFLLCGPGIQTLWVNCRLSPCQTE